MRNTFAKEIFSLSKKNDKITNNKYLLSIIFEEKKKIKIKPTIIKIKLARLINLNNLFELEIIPSIPNLNKFIKFIFDLFLALGSLTYPIAFELNPSSLTYDLRKIFLLFSLFIISYTLFEYNL